MPVEEHAKLSPSGSKRWMACPGCIRLSEGIPNKTSVYAEEGTAAHELAEEVLLKGGKPHDRIGETFNGFKVTKEMADAVEVYTDLIVSEAPGKTMVVEQPFKIYQDLWGTNDCGLMETWGRLDIFDYKHGAGVPVDIEGNTQLMIYALGAIGANNDDCFESVRMTIVQPRCMGEDVKRWEIPVTELKAWEKEVLQPACEKVREAGIDPEKHLACGDHCKWCPAMPTCPEIQKEAQLTCKADFSKPVLELPDYSILTVDELGKIIAFSEILSTYAKGAKAYGQTLLEEGTAVDGWKLVAKRSNRKIKDPAAFEAFFQPTFGDEIYEDPKLKGIGKLEKLIGKKDFASHCYKPDGGVTIAPVSDKRPPVASSATLDFAPVKDKEPDFLA